MSNPPMCHDREACVENPHNNREWTKRHEGYRHAESWEEVDRAIAAGDVFDVDGDTPISIKLKVGGVEHTRTVLYRQWVGGGQNDYDLGSTEWGYILVPDFKPVTDNEEAAAIASILRREA